MRFVMKQQLFAWGNDFVIRDANDREVYFVDGRVFSLGSQLSFQDMDGRELVFIKQKLFSWGPTFEIFCGTERLAVVSKKIFTLFECAFEVDVPGPNDLTAKGDFMDHEYVFYRDGESVATVSKQWFTWADTYGVDIADNENELLILAGTVVIDMACHTGKRH